MHHARRRRSDAHLGRSGRADPSRESERAEGEATLLSDVTGCIGLPRCPSPPYTGLMATIKKPSKSSSADAAKVKVVDSKRAMASLRKIRERDAELLKRLSR